jgi:hypothetical protein
MNCRPGYHNWEMITVEQDGREIRLRRCERPGCERWDEMRGVWNGRSYTVLHRRQMSWWWPET